jgi:glycosidase
MMLMRRAMIEAMQFWVKEFDIDGFRCDMAHLVPLDFWRQARTALDVLKPLFWLAETEDTHYLDVFDCCTHGNGCMIHKDILKGNQFIWIEGCIVPLPTRIPGNTSQMFFTANHDENSWNGTEYEKYGNAAKVFAVFSFVWSGLPLIYSGQNYPIKTVEILIKILLSGKQSRVT